MKKSWGFFLFPFAICILASGVYLFFQVKPDDNTHSLKNSSFTGQLALQACPPNSQNPNCNTPIPPTPVPPTPVPPTPIPPTPPPPTPVVNPVNSDSEAGPNRHATLTAVAALNLPGVSASDTPLPVDSPAPFDPGYATAVPTSIVEDPTSTPLQNPEEGISIFTIIIFGIIAVILLVGLGSFVRLLSR